MPSGAGLRPRRRRRNAVVIMRTSMSTVSTSRISGLLTRAHQLRVAFHHRGVVAPPRTVGSSAARISIIWPISARLPARACAGGLQSFSGDGQPVDLETRRQRRQAADQHVIAVRPEFHGVVHYFLAGCGRLRGTRVGATAPRSRARKRGTMCRSKQLADGGFGQIDCMSSSTRRNLYPGLTVVGDAKAHAVTQHATAQGQHEVHQRARLRLFRFAPQVLQRNELGRQQQLDGLAGASALPPCRQPPGSGAGGMSGRRALL